MSKTGKTAVVLAMAAGAVFLGIPLLDKCLGWFGCAFRPWVLSAAIVVPTVLLVAAVLTVMGRAIKGTVADKWEESSVVVKTIETFVLLIATGFLCLGIGGFGMILYGFSDTSEYVAERGGQVGTGAGHGAVGLAGHRLYGVGHLVEHLLHREFLLKILDC